MVMKNLIDVFVWKINYFDNVDGFIYVLVMEYFFYKLSSKSNLLLLYCLFYKWFVWFLVYFEIFFCRFNIVICIKFFIFF